MPKELNLFPNQRIDLEDLRYGTRTFTVDSLKDHVHRLFSGDYSGGFVLEGFRVEIVSASNRTIMVHNGLALDREGRLITFEEDDQNTQSLGFKDNSDSAPVPLTLTSTPGTYCVYVEFQLADSAKDSRAFWDPTYENADIVDAPGGDTHAAQKGKETLIDVPVRLCHSYKAGFQSGSFSDSSDPNTLRIPVASITVTSSNTISANTSKARTTIIKSPSATLGNSITELVCANTRHFPTTGTFEVFNQETASKITFENSKTSFTYTNNDRYNGKITGISLLQESSDGTNEIIAGDFIIATTGPDYITEGTSSDNRPMFFSFTDPGSATNEPGVGSKFSEETRNQKYFSGRALITNPSSSVAQNTATFNNRTTLLPRSRVENNIKNSQDFFRVLAVLIQEIKYGSPIRMTGTVAGVTSDNSNAITHQAKNILVDTSEFFTDDYLSATVTFTSGNNNGKSATVSGVIGDHVLHLSSGISNNIVDGQNYKIEKSILTAETFVDNKKIGSLAEVYDARVDKLNRTYQTNLQTKLLANKPFLLTIGDGINSFGDYNVKSGEDIGVVINDILDGVNPKRQLEYLGGTIYIKRGEYSLKSKAVIRENIHIKGDGPDNTKITGVYSDSTSCFFSVEGTTAKSGSSRKTIPGVKFSDIYLIGRAEGSDISSGSGGNSDVNAGGRHSIIIANETEAVFNFTLDNVRIKGGSYYTGTSGGGVPFAAKSSAVALGNADQETAMRDVKILNSRFEVTGRGINFGNTARNVKIDNCTFVSEEVDGADDIGGDFSFAGMVEGIRFARSGGGSYVYGENSSKAGGAISITNCDFMGQQTSLVPFNRGWIYFSSSLKCPTVRVSGCNFVGDILGVDHGDGYPFDYEIKPGVCIRNNANISLLISDCNFNTISDSIAVSAGKNIVKSCYFENVTVGIDVKDTANFIDFDSAGAQVNTVTILHVDSCHFISFTSSVNSTGGVGIELGDISSNTLQTNRVTVKSCVFENLSTAIDLSELSTVATASEQVAATNPTVYELIEISSCTHRNVKAEVVKMGATGTACFASGAQGTVGNNNKQKWIVRNFNYNNNVHQQCSADDSNCVMISGGHVVANGNIFDGYQRTVSQDCLYLIAGARSAEVCGNSFQGLEGASSSVKVTAIKFDVPFWNTTSDNTTTNDNDYVTVVMNGNKILCRDKAAANGQNNGILLTPWGHDVIGQNDRTSVVNGTFLNNDFSLTNMNFGILARQDINVTSSDETTTLLNIQLSPMAATKYRNWEWFSLNCQNNKIMSYFTDGVGSFDAQGNDLFATWSFSGGSEPWFLTAGPLQEGMTSSAQKTALGKLVAFMDMRFCKKHGTVNISNNILRNMTTPVVKESPVGSLSIKDFNTLVGIRILRFPGTLNISNNVIDGAPLIVKHTWGAGAEVRTIEGGLAGEFVYTHGYGIWLSEGSNADSKPCRMTVTNNDINCTTQGCAVDISGVPTNLKEENKTPDFFPSLHFAWNTVRGQCNTSSYHGHQGVIRIFPNSFDGGRSVAFVTDDDKSLNAGWMRTNRWEGEIKLYNNTLYDTIFYIDPASNGASIDQLDDTYSDSGTNNIGIVMSGNTKVVLADRFQFQDLCGFTEDRGRDFFGSTADKPKDPDLDDLDSQSGSRRNSPFIVVETTLVVTGDKTQRRRIVRGTRTKGDIFESSGLG